MADSKQCEEKSWLISICNMHIWDLKFYTRPHTLVRYLVSNVKSYLISPSDGTSLFAKDSRVFRIKFFWTLTLPVSPCTYDNNRLDPPHPDLLLVNSIQQCRVNIMNIMPALCQPNSVRLLKIRSGITPHSPSPHSGSDAAFKSPSPVTVDQWF